MLKRPRSKKSQLSTKLDLDIKRSQAMPTRFSQTFWMDLTLLDVVRQLCKQSTTTQHARLSNNVGLCGAIRVGM
ncbi:hypothetical protein HETIRDRAFT_422655 [Heterobasidion irregulare TC 32-1]|uniref:Uncharacterized protein n=1 Tax=Heterobasidion irregulare (strain TC 32-1) TaxID=747525 RepID=W4JSH2_HETIT|nr:uncharacterized protein HETIRDRAFT_422655 [Heterobasidion irregulare TC 32-1]ETW76060.1 hypothetical protein HETIRDRAFT_422655 [Heterobasidion irregulare TC 32-1]